LPAPLLYLRAELFLDEDFLVELFFAELFFAADFRPEVFLLADFFEDDLRPEDFFLLLAFLVAIWVLPPVKLEHSRTNFVASQDLRSSDLILLCDWKCTSGQVRRRRRSNVISTPAPAKETLVMVQ
jgi:hypothetical protein